jgi:DNA-binding MarR family transcriptional regulator
MVAGSMGDFLALTQIVLPEFLRNMAHYDIAIVDNRVLTDIWLHPGTRMGDIALRGVVADRNYISKVIVRLEIRDLVERKPDGRKAYRLYLTPKGQGYFEFWTDSGLSHVAQLFIALTPAERQTFFDLCGKLVQGLNPEQKPSWWRTDI